MFKNVMRKVFCFGNDYFKGDEVAKNLISYLETKDFEFVISDSPMEVLNSNEEVIILDVVKGISKVRVIDDIDKLELENSVTCHDLDLGFYLKLLKQSGKIQKVTIIGIPFAEVDYEKLKKKVEIQLKKI